MLRNRVAYNCKDSFTSGDQDMGIRYTSDDEPSEDDDEDNDSEYMQEIPYTSSSVDRSSIGSIPWADDAIKKNLLDWERIERMLHGQEELTDEIELRNEILEWQRKFPDLVGAENVAAKRTSDDSMQKNSFDSPDLQSLSNLSLNSINEHDDHEQHDNGEPTPTNSEHRVNSFLPKVKTKANGKHHAELKLMNEQSDELQYKDISLISMPVKLHQRYAVNRNTLLDSAQHHVKPSFKSVSLSPPTPTPPSRRLDQQQSSPLAVPLSASMANYNGRRQSSQMRMPPILNVQESTKRRFNGAVNGGNNRSFVQLSHIQQAKSAVATASRTHQRTQDRQSTNWRLPLAAASLSSRFLHNRNTIILPSIHLENVQESNSKDKVNDLRFLSSVPLRGTYAKLGSGQTNLNLSTQGRTTIRSSNITTPATSSTGRSISAAVHPQSRYEFNTFYVPYSASKFKVLKLHQ